MQPTDSPSPWPKRLLIAGVTLVIIGLSMFFLLSESVNEKVDPRQSSEFVATYGDDNVFNLTSGCWIVSSINTDVTFDLTFNKIENSTISSKEIATDCKYDVEPQSTDGTLFKVHQTLDIDDNEQVQVVINCSEESSCGDVHVYLTNNGDAMLLWFDDLPLLFSGLFCCIGFILIPFGAMLIMINKGRAAQIELAQNDIITSLTPLHDEVDSKAPLLTTDEVYRLMKGDIPEEGFVNPGIKEEVPSPFSNKDTRVKNVVNKSGSINSPSEYTHSNPPKDDAWKKWDDA
ncbi:MAG: hypothetical protein QGI21_05135 [Candidatus Poseidoniaceae archaeon]|jgi:hypothetical protein|nr:hypothetical protein [Candidatus Poseidoniaceae archaeon]